jgi:hypothetical protein
MAQVPLFYHGMKRTLFSAMDTPDYYTNLTGPSANGGTNLFRTEP